jgi:hypothetical protein
MMTRAACWRRDALVIGGAIVALAFPMFIGPLAARVVYLSVVLTVYGVVAWLVVAVPARRALRSRDLASAMTAP